MAAAVLPARTHQRGDHGVRPDGRRHATLRGDETPAGGRSGDARPGPGRRPVARLPRSRRRVAARPSRHRPAARRRRTGGRSRVSSARRRARPGGGFEHDAELRERLLDGPYDQPLSPPVNRGDALRLADGAAVDFVSESWSWPASAGPTTWPDGTARPVLMLSERMLPHVIWVNAAGRRFVNESSHNAALAFAETDPGTGLPRNTPAWAIADAQFRARYAFAGAAPASRSRPTSSRRRLSPTSPRKPASIRPSWPRPYSPSTPTPKRRRSRLRPGNRRVRPLLGRSGGTTSQPGGTIAEPPFCALPVLPGLVGTKGGLRTDTDARVLRWNGQPIPGLFAAGNAMAAVIGPAIISPGATIGSALAWGWIAGTAACV
ncbi:FAD-binding protein [Fodinicola feengrottensis]|uniref:FAD-binding protein n=1 Tax=Fodinicola feengrottensis TaxID=435914 RepID=UPI0013D8ADF3|nr:FAD-binding protein [Fodinicola feengrottensis]